MFRSLFFAIGIFLLIFGAQTLLVDKWIMSYASPVQTAGQYSQAFGRNPYRTASYAGNSVNTSYYRGVRGNQNVVKPVYQTKEWMPWSLLAAGTVIVLYSISSRSNDESNGH